MHEFFPENLRNPARSRRAGLMCQFPTNQVYSSVHSCIYTSVITARDSDAKKYTLYIVDLHTTKLYEEVSQIMLIYEASVLSRLGRLE